MKKYKTLKEFYPYYLTEHSDKTTKLFHFIGTALSIFFIVRLIITLEPINFVFALKKINQQHLPIPFIACLAIT